jgi:hypothetical protein
MSNHVKLKKEYLEKIIREEIKKATNEVWAPVSDRLDQNTAEELITSKMEELANAILSTSQEYLNSISSSSSDRIEEWSDPDAPSGIKMGTVEIPGVSQGVRLGIQTTRAVKASKGMHQMRRRGQGARRVADQAQKAAKTTALASRGSLLSVITAAAKALFTSMTKLGIRTINQLKKELRFVDKIISKIAAIMAGDIVISEILGQGTFFAKQLIYKVVSIVIPALENIDPVLVEILEQILKDIPQLPLQENKPFKTN